MSKSKGDFDVDEYLKCDYHNEMLDEIHKEGVSLIALDPAKDNKLVGIRTSYIIDKEDPPKPVMTLADYKAVLPETLANILKVTEDLLPGSKVFARYPQCKRIFSMYALGTHSDCTGVGD